MDEVNDTSSLAARFASGPVISFHRTARLTCATASFMRVDVCIVTFDNDDVTILCFLCLSFPQTQIENDRKLLRFKFLRGSVNRALTVSCTLRL